jgi:hypothetical protein
VIAVYRTAIGERSHPSQIAILSKKYLKDIIHEA